MKKWITAFTAAAVLGTASLAAEEQKHGDSHAEHHAEHQGGHHSNHVSVFWGATTFIESSTTAFTVGLDYEYRLPFLNNLFGIGALADFAFISADETAAVYAGFIGIHPIAGLKILIAPGFEAVYGPHPHEAFVLRGSVGYDIMINQFSITPIVSVDWAPESNAISLVYGVATGIGF